MFYRPSQPLSGLERCHWFPDGQPLPGQLWPGHRFLSEGPLAGHRWPWHHRPALPWSAAWHRVQLRPTGRPRGWRISRGWCLLMGLVPLPPHLARW